MDLVFTHGIVNEPAYFTIVTKDAGAGRISLSFEGPSKTEIRCKDNGDGTCTVSYVPTTPGEYHITVKFAGQNISGSPFTSIITCSAGEIRCKSQFGRSIEYELKAVEVDINNLMATVRTPSGTEQRCLLKKLANNHLGISFTPLEVGVHLVNVYGIGNQIQNSPFKITVRENELGNASKFKVLGSGLEKGIANELSEFVVDNKDAVKTTHYVEEACSPVHLWQTHGYEDRQNQSTIEEDADTFDKHEKIYLHREYTTCEKVCLTMERSNSTLNGHIFQSSINLLNFKSKNNDSLFSFSGNCSQSTNEGSYMLWFQFCQCRKSPGILQEVFTQDWKVFRVRTFQNNLLLQTPAGIFDLASVSRACQIKNTLPIEEDRHCIHIIALPSGERDTVKEFLFKWPAIVDSSSAAAERQIINPGPGKVIPANSMRLRCQIVQVGRSYCSKLVAFLPQGTKQAVCYGYDLVIISPECENVICTDNDSVVICKHGKSIWCYKNSLAICSVSVKTFYLKTIKFRFQLKKRSIFTAFSNRILDFNCSKGFQTLMYFKICKDPLLFCNNFN
ncbi:FLNA [Mytilus edulis]|uniref:FLNA n=1 Tax=Mytilus edulis TaxID=6550 RepID=A0A8S3U7B6_MYTED|nr:FLNA [Mytilus edulis]